MKDVRMSRLIPLKQDGRDFDVEFWQNLGPDAILRAAWGMVVAAERIKNPHAEVRLQRNLAVLKRLRS